MRISADAGIPFGDFLEMTFAELYLYAIRRLKSEAGKHADLVAGLLNICSVQVRTTCVKGKMPPIVSPDELNPFKSGKTTTKRKRVKTVSDLEKWGETICKNFSAK